MSPAETVLPTATDDPADAILRLATAYQGSQALFVGVQLGLPDLLAEGPRPAEALAAATETYAPSLRRLLLALASFGVVTAGEDGRFALTATGQRLRADAPASLRPLVLMYGHEEYWRCWGVLEHCVRTGETAAAHLFGPGDAFARYAADPALSAAMNDGQTALSVTVAQAIVASYDFSSVEWLLDVGGGQGQLLAAILRAHPHLRGTLFDRPNVVAAAPHVLEAAGVAGRCEMVGGDFFAGVPPGADCYLLSRVINSFDERRAVAALAACRGALTKPGARLVIAERLLSGQPVPGRMAQENALADLNMLVRTGGRNHSVEEFRQMLDAAGMRLERVIPTGGPVSLIEASAR